MSIIKKFNDFKINESDGIGSYTTEEIDDFFRELVNSMEWSGKDVPEYKRIRLKFPSISRNESEIATDKEDALNKWKKMMEHYKKDADKMWRVWDAKVGGSLNKPKKFKDQAYDIDSILDIVKKYPDSIRSLSITMDNKEGKQFAKSMSDEYKERRYSGD